MTKEKMIEVLYNAMNMTNKDIDAWRIMKDVRDSFGKIDNSLVESIPEYAIASVIYSLEQEIITAESKKSGSSNKLAVMKSILKEANNNKPVFKKTIITDDYQVALDGYRALFSKEKLSVPINEVSDIVTSENIESFKKLASDLLEKINYCDTEITVCDYKTLESEYRVRKAAASKYNKDRVRVLIDDKYMFNAKYLIEGLKAINTDKVYSSGTNRISVIKNDNDAYILMPVSYKDVEEEKRNDLVIVIQNGKIIK